jgi:hypothetical protein
MQAHHATTTSQPAGFICCTFVTKATVSSGSLGRVSALHSGGDLEGDFTFVLDPADPADAEPEKVLASAT